MLKLSIPHSLKRVLRYGGLAIVLGPGLTAGPVSAAAVDKLWTVTVHLSYIDGSEYDVPFAHGVTTQELPSILAACGASHAHGAGAVVCSSTAIPCLSKTASLVLSGVVRAAHCGWTTRRAKDAIISGVSPRGRRLRAAGLCKRESSARRRC